MSFRPPPEGQPSAGQIARYEQPAYEYHMVQLPSNYSAQAGQTQGNEIASYVQEWANKLSAQGWEFYRIDTMSMTTHPGCLASLFGAGNQYTQYSIMTFRRAR